MPKLVSYKHLYAKYGIDQTKAKQIVYRLQLPRTMRGGRTYFKEEDAQKIIEWKGINRKTHHHRRKISIIEEYMRQPSARKTASILRVQKELVNKAVKEWEENDYYIVVESSMNYENPFGIKNIGRKGSKWNYKIVDKGKTYYKGGFETEEEAFEALQKLKEKLRVSL